jgi:hypothetical protein
MMTNSTPYRVTEYKVCQAIANGVPLHEDTLVKAAQRPAQEVLAVLIKLYPDQFGTPGVDVLPRTEATLDELVTYARDIYSRGGVDAILGWEYWPSACCCMGPRDGHPLCVCLMQEQLARHKAAVAARLMEEMGEE